jgi:hypothetical protein
MTLKYRILAIGMGLGLLGWASGCAFYHEGGRCAYSFGKAQINIPASLDPVQANPKVDGSISKGEKKLDGGAGLVTTGNPKEQGTKIMPASTGSIKKVAVSEGEDQLPDTIVVVPEKGNQSRIGNAFRNLFDRKTPSPGPDQPSMVPNEFPLPPSTTTPNPNTYLPQIQGNQPR